VFVYHGALGIILQGISNPAELEEARAFFAAHPAPAAQLKIAQVRCLHPLNVIITTRPRAGSSFNRSRACVRVTQALEKVAHNIACLQRNREPLAQWLASSA
jgi:hypothetical protein